MRDNDLDFLNGKRAFVTGHTGFKGSWLCSILLAAGANVYGYALQPPTNPSMFEMLKLDRKMKSVIGDIRDYESLYRAMTEAQPEIVFHLAAQPIVRLSYKQPIETFSANVMGTANLLEVVRHIESVKACVIITTDKVYENREWTWGYRENDRLGGSDPYAASKACAELVVKSYRASFFGKDGHYARIATARAGNVIGGGDYAPDRLMPDCVRSAKRGEPIAIRNPLSIRPWQHVLEPLRGYILLAGALLNGQAICDDAFNFGPEISDSISARQLADIFCRAWGEGASWISTAEKNAPHESAVLRLDNTKAKTVLHWKPAMHVSDAVKLTVDWEKSNDKEAITNLQINRFFNLKE